MFRGGGERLGEPGGKRHKLRPGLCGEFPLAAVSVVEGEFGF